jgi:hypothetical protein
MDDRRHRRQGTALTIVGRSPAAVPFAGWLMGGFAPDSPEAPILPGVRVPGVI